MPRATSPDGRYVTVASGHRVGNAAVVALRSLEGHHPATLDPLVSFRFLRGLPGVVLVDDAIGGVAVQRRVRARGCSAGNRFRQLSH